MLLDWYILYKLKVDLCFPKYTIRGNIVSYEGCTDPIKYVNKIDVKITTEKLYDKRFHNEELW